MLHSKCVCFIWVAIALACSSGDAAGTPASDKNDAAGPVASAAGGSGAAPAAPSASQAPQPASFTADAAEPYFRGGPAGPAAERFALEDWRGARDGFAAYLKDHGSKLDTASRARAELLMAIADANLGAWRQAAKGFESALAGLPLLSHYIHYQAARAHYFARNNQAAMKHARAVAADSIVGADAELLIGDMLRGKKAHREMAEHYGKYLRERPKGIRISEARFRLAEAQEALGKAIPEALELYRTIAITAPLISWASKSKERLDVLLPKVPEKQRSNYRTLIADELITRGMQYYDAMRNPESEADFEAALKAPGLTAATKCVAAYHRANSVFKARNRTRAAPLFDEAFTACKEAGDIDLQVKSAYQAGRSYAHIGEHKTALERYRQSEDVARAHDHSFADDARLRQAEEHADLGDDAGVRETLSTIPERYPQGDMRAEALWRLGWRAYQNQDYKEAIGWFQKQIDTVPIDNNYWAEGQPQYWMARSYAKLKNKTKAIASYREAVIKYPLSYYALLALNRMRESYPAAYTKVLAEIRANPPGYDPKAPAFQFAPRVEFASPGFARALELMRLNLGEPAEAELRRLGMSTPAGKDEVTDPDQVQKLWATAFLYDRAGRYEQSHWITRWHVLDYKRQWPTGHNRARWDIAYPKGYWELLNRHATQHGFPVELLIGIVREESAFNPLMESYANAIGLTQMIFPTAERFAKGTGIQVTRDNLRDPEKNVTIGSRFLAFLWSKWDGQVMLVPPSYNAGEGAVTRWLKMRGNLPADEWLESIKTDQARRYSARVLSSYFAYTYLGRGEVPVVSNIIPERLLPEGAPGKKSGAKATKGKP